MREFLNPDQGYKLVRCEVGETAIPDNWIEIPKDVNIAIHYKRNDKFYFWKDEDTYLRGNVWVDCKENGMTTVSQFKNEWEDSIDFIWQREKVEVEVDNVNQPSHYVSHPSGVECIEITRHHDFAIGNAIKYLWRAGLKDSNNEIQDLEKAVWYIQDKIKQLKGE